MKWILLVYDDDDDDDTKDTSQTTNDNNATKFSNVGDDEIVGCLAPARLFNLF